MLRHNAIGAPISTLIGRPSGGSASTARVGEHLYVFPTSVQPLIGRVLDPALFDLSAIAKSANHRLPVSITYADAGSPTAVTGVEITARHGNTASGVITPASSAALGRALAKGNAAAVLANVASMRSAAATSPQPNYPMHTLSISTIGRDGKPVDAFLGWINTTDARKGGGFVATEHGRAKISVPAGTYQFLSSLVEGDAFYLVAGSEFSVTEPRSVTLDLRTATTPFRTTLPKPVGDTLSATSLDRIVETDGYGSTLSMGVIGALSNPVFVSPTVGQLHGGQALIRSVWAHSPARVPAAYSYNTYYAVSGRIPRSPIVRHSGPGNLMTHQSSFHGPPSMPLGSLATTAVGPLGGWTLGTALTTPQRLTRYVTAGPGIMQLTEFIQDQNWETGDVRGWFEAPFTAPPAGSVVADDDWGKAPLHTRFPLMPLGPNDPVICPSCVGGKQLSMVQLPMADSRTDHIGNGDFVNGTMRATYRITADKKVIASSDAGFINVNAPYPADTKVITTTQTSTRSGAPFPYPTTMSTTLSTPVGAAIAKPGSWSCALSTACSVLPFLSVDYSAATTLTNALPAGNQSVGLTVRQVGRSTAIGVTKVAARVSYDGRTWTNVPVTGSGANYALHLAVPRAEAGRTTASLEVRVTDKAGSTLIEKITGAFGLPK